MPAKGGPEDTSQQQALEDGQHDADPIGKSMCLPKSQKSELDGEHHQQQGQP